MDIVHLEKCRPPSASHSFSISPRSIKRSAVPNPYATLELHENRRTPVCKSHTKAMLLNPIRNPESSTCEYTSILNISILMLTKPACLRILNGFITIFFQFDFLSTILLFPLNRSTYDCIQSLHICICSHFRHGYCQNYIPDFLVELPLGFFGPFPGRTDKLFEAVPSFHHRPLVTASRAFSCCQWGEKVHVVQLPHREKSWQFVEFYFTILHPDRHFIYM